MSWRETLKSALLENPYAKHAKVPSGETLHGVLQLLHTERKRDESLIEVAAVATQPVPVESDVGFACDFLNRVGVRILRNSGGSLAISFSKELDSPDLRAALRILKMDHLPVQRAERAPISYLHWKALELNVLFEAQGATGELGRITPATIRHGWQPEVYV
jgi:hypothetical protein